MSFFIKSIINKGQERYQNNHTHKDFNHQYMAFINFYISWGFAHIHNAEEGGEEIDYEEFEEKNKFLKQMLVAKLTGGGFSNKIAEATEMIGEDMKELQHYRETTKHIQGYMFSKDSQPINKQPLCFAYEIVE